MHETRVVYACEWNDAPPILTLTRPHELYEPVAVKLREVVAQYREREQCGVRHDEVWGAVLSVLLS